MGGGWACDATARIGARPDRDAGPSRATQYARLRSAGTSASRACRIPTWRSPLPGPLAPAPLGPNGRALLERALSWCDAQIDPEVSLPAGQIPEDGLHPTRIHFVQQTIWYAFSLLARDAPGDRDRASDVLEASLALQYRDPTRDEGKPWFGTFARFAESPQPEDGAVPYYHFDPNWRQFLGTSLLLTLAAFEPRLDAGAIRRIEEALARCVRGEPPDRVPPSYTNIALMRAFLESEVGARLGEPAWQERGLAIGRAVAQRFDRHGVFEEYNSATYYGVDLYALALWRRCASAPLLREEGARIEAAMWRDVARWYHPGLRNLCGPYSRTYGMDMRRYLAMLGLWIAFGLDLDAKSAPLPEIDPGGPIRHGHDLFTAGPFAWLGAEIPEDARARLTSLEAPRSLRQTLSIEEARVVTGRLDANFMIGGETCRIDRSAFDQYVPATLHWRRPDDEIGWLWVRAPGPSCARAQGGALQIDWPCSSAHAENPLVVTIGAPELKPQDLGDREWRLPGLTLEVDHDLAGPELEMAAHRSRLRFARPAGSRPGRLRLTPQR